MKKNKNTNYRSRKFCLLLYPDNEEHNTALDYIKTHYNYCLILHDLDTKETGETKKPHYHVVLDFSNAKWNTALSQELNISTQFIQQCNNFEHALEYLIHYNDDTKHQYDINKTQGPLKRKLINFITKNDNTEEERIQYIFDFIYSFDCPISYKNLCEYCHKIGVWGDLRRNATIIFRLLDEHNARYFQIKEKET